MPDELPDWAQAPDDTSTAVTNSAATDTLPDWAREPDIQELPDWAKDTEASSDTPATDKALNQSREAMRPKVGEGRAKEFVKGLGVPTSLEDIKQFVTRSPIQDVKDIASDVAKIPEKVRNFGKTLSTSPAATVARDPLSPEAFGVYGTTLGMLAPAVFEKLKGGESDAIRITSTESVPQREVRTPVGEKTPLRQQGTPAGAQEQEPVSTGESVATEVPQEPNAPQSLTAELPESKLTSTKNAVVDQERIARGLQPIATDAGTAHPETWAKAEKRLSENPLAGKLLVEDIVDHNRQEFSTEDEALLLREKIATQTARQGASSRVLDPNLSESDRTQARSDFDALESHSQRIDEAMHKTGAKWSEFGRFRQLLAADDYSLRAMNDRLRVAKGDKPITPQETASIKSLHDKISDLQGKLDAHESARMFDTEFKKLVDQSRKEAKSAKTKGTRFTDFMDQKANEARQRIVAKRGRLTTGFDPTSITDEAIIGASHIAKGLTKFADWSAQMIREFGERVRPFLNDIWDKAKSLHDANSKEYGDKALARYKTYLGKQTEQLQSKIEAGDFVKSQRQKTKLDAEAFTMRANLQKLKNEFERGVNKEVYKNKTPAQKFWDHFVGFERAMKLSGPSVFGKLGVAAMTREVLSPMEAGVGYGVSKVVPRFVEGTRYGAGFKSVLRSEIKAKAAFFTNGMKDLAQNVKGKETELDALSGKYGTQPRFWYNRIGDMHAAIKAPVKRAAFTRSLEARMESAIKSGEDINHPEVMARLSNEAVMDANREIFQENTVVSKMFSMIEHQSPVAGRVARFLYPVVKIPVNLFKEFVNLHVGAPVAATRIGMAYWKGVESLPALQREAIIRQLVKGSVGGAGLLWSYYNSDKVRAFFDKVPNWFQHTPMAMVLNEGSYLKKLGGNPLQAKQARKELTYMAKTGIPFMYSTEDITKALDANNSHAILNWINNMTESTVVPQISSQIAKQMDTPGKFPSNISKKPNWRVPRTPIEAVKSGIPGLRQQVPQRYPRE